MPSAISYTRFSSTKQTYGDSLRRQKDLQARWLQAHAEYTLSPLTFEDLGKSGWSGQHLENGFGRLLSAIQAGVIVPGDCIIVEAIDRTGRLEPMKMIPVLSEILLAGVTITTLDDGTEYTRESVNGHHLFLLLAKIQQANAYSESLSRRVKASYEGRRIKAKEGKQIKRRTPVWLSSEGELIAEIQPHIKRIFEDYAAGIGERRIINRLRADKATPIAMTTVNPSTIKRWLRDRQVIGYWGDIPNVYPAAIPAELFYRVQQKLQDNSRTVAAPTKFLLTGVVKCGHCYKNFGIRQHKHSPAVYGCATRSRVKAECDNARSIPKQVLEYIRITTSLPFVQQALESQQLTISQQRLVEIDGELSHLSKSISALATTITSVGLIREIQDALTQHQQKRTELETERTLLLQDNASSLVSNLDAVSLESSLLDDDPMKLNALLQSVGYSITCYADGLILVSGELYPWLYKGVDRLTGHYLLENLGQEIRLPMLRQSQLEAIDAFQRTQPKATGPLLPFIQRERRVRKDTA